MNRKHRNTEIPEYRNIGNPAAFTLVELLMALAITAMIGMSVVMVSTALSNAQAGTDSMIEAVSSGRYAMMSIDADVRKAGLITAVGSGEMVVWTGDEYADEQINISELVLIQSDTDNQTVERLQVVFPDSMPPKKLAKLNISVTLAEVTDTGVVRKLLTDKKYSNYLARRTLAENASNFEVVTDDAPPMSRLVLLRLAVGQQQAPGAPGGGGQQIKLTNTAHPRADATACVTFIEGVPVLDLSNGGGSGDDPSVEPFPIEPSPIEPSPIEPSPVSPAQPAM